LVIFKGDYVVGTQMVISNPVLTEPAVDHTLKLFTFVSILTNCSPKSFLLAYFRPRFFKLSFLVRFYDKRFMYVYRFCHAC